MIPTWNAAATIRKTLDSLGSNIDAFVVDARSTDETAELAAQHGAKVLLSERGRGIQLALGATAAGDSWLLFLHADTLLDKGWLEHATVFMSAPGNQGKAAVFRFSLDDLGVFPRCLELLVSLRSRWLAAPYGDQGLLIHRHLYDAIGGYKSIPLMEDVDIVRRLGRRRLVHLGAVAITSAWRYQRTGYLRRSVVNLSCLLLYFCGAPMKLIVRLYGP